MKKSKKFFRTIVRESIRELLVGKRDFHYMTIALLILLSALAYEERVDDAVSIIIAFVYSFGIIMEHYEESK